MLEIKEEIPYLLDIKVEEDSECNFIEYYPDYSNIKLEDQQEYENVPLKDEWNSNTDSCYTCRHCNQVFSLLSEFEKHAKENKREICEICWKDFATKNNLLEHLSLHTGDKPYKCSTCNAQFAHRSNRDRHVKLHGDKPFRCEKCGLGFISNSRLKEHLKHYKYVKNVVEKPRPFVCEICNKAFQSLAHKKEHNRTHTQENCFACELCKKSFRYKCSLTRHMKRHTSDNAKGFKEVPIKSFACHLCNKYYLNQSCLDRHIKHHNNHEVYACDKCNSTFTFKQNLFRHRNQRCDG